MTAVARRSLDFLILAPDPAVIPPVATDLFALRLTMPEQELLVQNFDVVDQIWEPEFLDSVYEKVAALESPNTSGDLLAIATSLPNSKLPCSLRQLLNENWKPTPKTCCELSSSRCRTCATLGTLFVLKSMLGEDNWAETRGGQTNRQVREARRAAGLDGGRGRDDSHAGAAAGIRGQDRRRGRGAARSAGEHAALESADYFDARAQLRRKQKKSKKDDKDDKDKLLDVPLEITADAEVLNSYTLRWPEGLEGKTSAPVSPMLLY